MESNEELESCPFCGGEARILHGGLRCMATVECCKCGASVKAIDEMNPVLLAVEKWNKRVVGRKVTIGGWEPVRTDEGVWENGTDYEYEFAYCSVCGRMQYAGWDSHKEAKEKIEGFHEEYKFCPSCGAKMTGGQYVE